MGSVIIVIGFYSVMWGKAKEVKVIEKGTDGSSSRNSEKAPLLPTEDDEMRV